MPTSLTVYQNRARASGGGLFVDTSAAAGRVRVNNSIIAGNNSTGQGLDVFGTSILSQGFNFIGSGDNSAGWIASDRKGTDAARLDPGLGNLQDNGGKSETIVVPETSPLFRRGNLSLWGSLDQRGLTRNGVDPNDPNVKYVTIGAYDPDAS